MKLTKESCKQIIGSVLTLLPLLLAVAAAQPWVALGACLAALWWPMERAGVKIAGLVFVLLQDIALRHGNAHGVVASLLVLALAGELLLLYSQRKENAAIARLLRQLRPPKAFYPGASLGAAVLLTFSQGSGYFAIGAHGAGLPALLQSYGQLGFHPNWRTVLFSTIMLVVLIAWPRKFRTLAQVLPAGFVGLVLVTGLNFLLNPDPARSTVQEFPFAWLPFLGRTPVSALSTLLLFEAWEEVPWRRLRACLASPAELALLCVVPVLLCCFDLLWVCAGIALAWDSLCVARCVRQRITKAAAIG